MDFFSRAVCANSVPRTGHMSSARPGGFLPQIPGGFLPQIPRGTLSTVQEFGCKAYVNHPDNHGENEIPCFLMLEERTIFSWSLCLSLNLSMASSVDLGHLAIFVDLASRSCNSFLLATTIWEINLPDGSDYASLFARRNIGLARSDPPAVEAQ